jgi:hypothetical protein
MLNDNKSIFYNEYYQLNLIYLYQFIHLGYFGNLDCFLNCLLQCSILLFGWDWSCYIYFGGYIIIDLFLVLLCCFLMWYHLMRMQGLSFYWLRCQNSYIGLFGLIRVGGVVWEVYVRIFRRVVGLLFISIGVLVVINRFMVSVGVMVIFWWRFIFLVKLIWVDWSIVDRFHHSF